MAQTFKDAFPRTHAVQPFTTLAPNLAWASQLDWADDKAILAFWLILFERQQYAGDRDYDWLDEFSDALIHDLNALLRDAEARGEPPDGTLVRSLLFLRFLASIVPMERAFGLGRRGPAHDWAFRGLSTDHDRSRRLNRGYSYLPLRQSGDPLIAAVAMRHLPRWCITFFLLARDANIRKEIAETFAVCWDILGEMLALDGPGRPELQFEIFSALSSLASWAIIEDYHQRDEWVMALVRAWHAGEIPRSAASIVAVNFITRANPVTGRGVRDWAQEILDSFGDTLREHERLQFLVATIDTHERWRATRQTIFDEIEDLNQRASAVEEVGSSPLFARDARIDILKPLIRMLVLEQDLAGAMDLLRAWYGKPGAPPCDDNVLFVHPALGDGVAMLWPGRARISFDTADDGHEIVVDALDDALGIVRDPDVEAIEEHREGMPDYRRGPAVEAAMVRYYRPAELAAAFKRLSDPRSMVVFPSVSDPLQALLARELSLTLPLEVSLAEALPMRPIRQISIWAGYTQFTHFEVQLIQDFAAQCGWLATVFSGSEDGDAEDFRRFYEQPGPDILWVCGHGEYVAHRLDETGIVVAPPRTDRHGESFGHVILPMQVIAGFETPNDGRRLLVLNTCNGATTQGMAGMARIGLAQSLVQPNQMVIGHLWPASAAVALAFGGLLASNLGRHDVIAAFGATLAELRDPSAIVPLIEDRLGAPFAGGFRVTSAREDLLSILAWGCPVLLT